MSLSPLPAWVARANAQQAEQDAPKYDWRTTSPNPWRPAHTHGADQGQVGWKLHITDPTQGVTLSRGRQVSKQPALCGLVPRHGWGLDLFIEDKCSRCVKAAARLGIAEPPL